MNYVFNVGYMFGSIQWYTILMMMVKMCVMKPPWSLVLTNELTLVGPFVGRKPSVVGV